MKYLHLIILTLSASCINKNNSPSTEALNGIELKRGEIVMCGPGDQRFGDVVFETSCEDIVREQFALAVSMLHSFEYDEAEKIFAKVIDASSECAMAYWGVAMANYHPLWTPPTEKELEKGAKAIEIAKSLNPKSKREAAYIDAIGTYYTDWKTIDHRSRSLKFEEAMGKIYRDFPEDKEAAIFYALALDGAADPADTTFKNQKEAGQILTSLYPDQPDHPGVIHYIIHSYDSPALAALALPAARKYASIAPSSAHAQHMPSHIFTRLGLWDDCIQSNLVSADAARCYAEQTGMKGHWDEELHATDYLMYGYLQKGDNVKAKEVWDYINTMQVVSPVNFKVAYAFAAVPSRYVFENKMWNEAADLVVNENVFSWDKYPWQKAIVHFTRLMGMVHTDRIDLAKVELQNLNSLHDSLTLQKDTYKANQVNIQMKSGEAWILFKEGKKNDAVAMMLEAAAMEDLTQKHPVTPGEVIPARELLGDMLLDSGNNKLALSAYEDVLKKSPNRFNAIQGAGLAAEKSNDSEKAKFYYGKLMEISKAVDIQRVEVDKARKYLERVVVL